MKLFSARNAVFACCHFGTRRRGCCPQLKNVYLFVVLLVTPGVRRQVLDDNDNAPVFLHPVSRPTTLTSVEETNASAGDDVMVWNKATSGHVIATRVPLRSRVPALLR